MKLICLLCKKILLSKTLFSRSFRMKYNLGVKSMLNKFKLFKKKWRHPVYLRIGMCHFKVIGTDGNNLSGVLE